MCAVDLAGETRIQTFSTRVATVTTHVEEAHREALLGHAVGEALGALVEGFLPPTKQEHLTDLLENGRSTRP